MRTTDDKASSKSKGLAHGILSWIGQLLIYVVVFLLVIVLVRIFLVQRFTIPSESMEETLTVKDTIMIWKPGDLHRGDIVVFRDDLGWLKTTLPPAPWWKEALAWIKVYPPQDEQYLVKRLIGLPGDHVTCCDDLGRVSVNSVALDESEYVYLSAPDVPQPSFDYIVPRGRIFVLGDHRDRSGDSRFHICDGVTPTPEIAFPAISSVQGRAFAILTPFSRMRTLPRPTVFDQVPDPTVSPPSPATVQWSCG